MSIEERVELLECQNKRQRWALLVLAVALCGVVSMAATVMKDGNFNNIRAKSLYIENEVGDVVISIDSNESGNGSIVMFSTENDASLSLVIDDESAFIGIGDEYQTFAALSGGSKFGGRLGIFNKTGEQIAVIAPNKEGKGVLGLWDRKGKGRIYDSK
jgi:hypothetical protein